MKKISLFTLVVIMSLFLGITTSLAQAQLMQSTMTAVPDAPTLNLPPGQVNASHQYTPAGSSFFSITLSGFGSGYDVLPGVAYYGWCIEDNGQSNTSNVSLYSTYDPSMPLDAFTYQDPNIPLVQDGVVPLGSPVRWSEFNYLLNHKQGTKQDIQAAIWLLMWGESNFYPPTQTAQNMVADALANGHNFVPAPGEVIAVLLYADGIGPSPDRQYQDTVIEVVLPPDTLPTVDLVKYVTPSTRPEPGGDFNYTLTITNTSPEPVTITALVDDNPLPAACTNLIGVTLPVGGSVSCTYTVIHTDEGVYPNTASVTVEDADGNTASDSDNETVTVTDVLPVIDLVKDVTPPTLPEPGGNFNYTLTIYNLSVEPVTITALVDDNPLPAACTNLIGQTIPVGGSVSCSYTVNHANPGVYPNTATATAEDNEGNSDSDSDSETVTVTLVDPVINVVKTADPTVVQEPGGDVTFTVVVTNNSGATDPVTIDTLVDDIHGNLDGQGTCSVPQTIQPGASYTCEFTATVSGNAGDIETDTVTASGYDDEQTPVSDSDDATVTIVTDDGLPEIEVVKTADPTVVQEPGGVVTFTVVVTNNSGQYDPVTITSLVDDIHGDLDGQGTCSVPQTIQPGASYTCEFPALVQGNAGDTETDTVTASGEDDEGNKVSDSDDATVTIVTDDGLPEIDVQKTADPGIVYEPGGLVTFTVLVTNNSGPDDPVTITSLVDDIHGDLDGQGTCSVPQTIQPGASYTCEFTAMVQGSAGDTETDTVTASGEDDEGNKVSDSDDAKVEVRKVLYTIYFPNADNEKAISGVVPMTVGYEDLQFDRPDMDFDYNDWVTNIDTKLIIDEESQDLYRIDFIVTPRARGGVRSHAFHINIPANTFATDGTATLTIKDENGNVISSSNAPFDASQANDYNVIPCTCDAFPVQGQIVNAVEGSGIVVTKRTAELSIEFYNPGPFDLSYLSEENISAPHGTGLFFDPYIDVLDFGFEIHQGDLRLLSVPEINWMWPEERVRIDQVYTDVLGNPPDFNFPDGWWKNHNTCVFGDGVKCPSALMSYIAE